MAKNTKNIDFVNLKWNSACYVTYELPAPFFLSLREGQWNVYGFSLAFQSQAWISLFFVVAIYKKDPYVVKFILANFIYFCCVLHSCVLSATRNTYTTPLMQFYSGWWFYDLFDFCFLSFFAFLNTINGARNKLFLGCDLRE